jgi:hypothetical protein
MPEPPVRVGLEVTSKKVFASALEWPGWSRAGKDSATALAGLAAAAPRYATCAKGARIAFPFDGNVRLTVVEEAEGNATTAFGAPDVRFEADHRRTTTADGQRLAALLETAWLLFDEAVEGAPATLRKGPRGGGRDRDKIVEHVHGADEGYARVIGVRPADHGSHEALRAAVLDVIRQPSDGSPLAGKKWTPRYAARRFAWHALDHAWEIQDRSDPAG